VPQFIPMAFIHTRQQALLAAVLIGLMGGLANAACIAISYALARQVSRER